MEHLIDYCETELQLNCIKTLIENGGNVRKTARDIEMARSGVQQIVARVRKKAESKGHNPGMDLDRKIPDGYKLKGFSDMRTNSEGKPIWYKVDQDKERQVELMQEMITALQKELPVYQISDIATKSIRNEDLLNCYVLSDYHLGMLAWADQTGDEDWNTEKAEQVLYKWFELAIQKAPDAEKCLFIQLGDFTHHDNQTGTTPKSGHVLDVDVPMNMVVNVAIRAMHNIIHMLAKKYAHVQVIVVDGNHDETGSKWLSGGLAYSYQDCTNVTIDNSPKSYFCYEWGDVSIFSHHGHIKKIGTVAEALASMFRDVFGRTKLSYCHMGHYHHAEVKENSLMIVEQHRTLSAKDNYASQGGYSSGRSAVVITYDKHSGEVARQTVSRDMVKV